MAPLSLTVVPWGATDVPLVCWNMIELLPLLMYLIPADSEVYVYLANLFNSTVKPVAVASDDSATEVAHIQRVEVPLHVGAPLDF